MSEALNHKGIWTDDASKALSEAANRSTQVAKEYLTLYGVTNNIANINTLLVPRAELESLRAEVAALKADAERLDYLDSLATYESRGLMGGTHQLIFSHDFVDEPNANFRAAIDAAKEQQ